MYNLRDKDRLECINLLIKDKKENKERTDCFEYSNEFIYFKKLKKIILDQNRLIDSLKIELNTIKSKDKINNNNILDQNKLIDNLKLESDIVKSKDKINGNIIDKFKLNTDNNNVFIINANYKTNKNNYKKIKKLIIYLINNKLLYKTNNSGNRIYYKKRTILDYLNLNKINIIIDNNNNIMINKINN